MLRWKVLLHNYISGEICFQLQRLHGPPRIQLCMGCILPFCSLRPILIVWHCQPIRDLIPGSNLGGNRQLSSLLTWRSALGAALRAMQLMGRKDTHPSSTQSKYQPRGHPGPFSPCLAMKSHKQWWHMSGIGSTAWPWVLPWLTTAWVENVCTDPQI